jgi:hypothetical protein
MSARLETNLVESLDNMSFAKRLCGTNQAEETFIQSLQLDIFTLRLKAVDEVD